MVGLNETSVCALKRYGIYFGTAFQIMDDCLDFKARENEFGKTLGADLQAGVLTLPLIRLISLIGDEEKARVFSKVKSGMGASDLESVVCLLREYGALEYATDRAREYTDRARLELSIFPESASRRSLEFLLDYVVERNR